jgi:hypothetical protein
LTPINPRRGIENLVDFLRRRDAIAGFAESGLGLLPDIGANAGWMKSSGNTITNTGTDSGLGGLGTALALGLIPGTIGVSHNGFIGGGQIGYNWHRR